MPRGRKLRIAICAAFAPGYEAVSFAARYPHPIEFVATCVSDTSPYAKKIAALCRQKKIKLYQRVNVNDPKFIAAVREHKIDVVILAWWPTIVHQAAIDAARIGWLNLHPSLLPYGRGKHPYYWSIVEAVPYGVTLHFIDASVDKGKILWQKKIPIRITDTAESLYTKALRTIIELFKQSYPRLVRGQWRARSIAQATNKLHYGAQIEQHSRIDLDKKYTGRELLNILRARSFTHGDSAYFTESGKKYQVRVTVSPAPAAPKSATKQ